jgi:ubiquinone/menaquinone biosynthesis C-methylase UbiE
MGKSMEQLENSYQRQAVSEESMKLPSRYTDPDSIDNWRHTRMLDLVQPLLKAVPGSTWLTVGDGRYASDAAYLTGKGADVIASSLTDERLKYAYEKGFIKRYQAENAEHISLSDNEVDFVLCKEAYHHFPRPPVALYEMLRVARCGVMLIEPMDNSKLLDSMKTLIKRVIRGDTEMRFEPSGNFIYRFQVRELAKMMTAMGGRVIAVKPFNDFYHPRLSKARSNTWNLGSVLTRLGVSVQDILCRLGLLGYGLCGAIAFKGVPDPVIVAALKADGFKVLDLPTNPYV